jgi:hypothetical protein
MQHDVMTEANLATNEHLLANSDGCKQRSVFCSGVQPIAESKVYLNITMISAGMSVPVVTHALLVQLLHIWL